MSISGDSARRLSSSRFRRRRADGRPADGAGDQGAHQEAARRRSAVRTLKSGGHVRVVVITDESGKSKLSFEYPDGPVTPRPEKLPEPRRAKKRRSTPRRKPSGPRGNDTPPRRGSVPKVPLVKV
jgi:hypothetical protein